jgi:uncharacterized NAD-dependent epimerase/dehydratase family protein
MIDFYDPNNTVIVYAPEAFSLEMRRSYPLRAKTADGYIRYANTHIIGVVDPTTQEENVSEILGIREDIPLYHTIAECLEQSSSKPTILMIGVAPAGGEATDTLLADIAYSIEHGMNIMSGMHYELNKDEQLVALAKKHNVSLWDVRVPPEDLGVASCKAYFVKKPIILTCAADAAIGKMTVGFEMQRQLEKKGIRGELLATGQTAIMIKGSGISIDRVIGDFMPGATEKLVVEADPNNRFLIIEGQGGLSHPGYAPVTLGLLHGGMPTHAILIVRPQRKHSIGSKLILLPSTSDTMKMYQGVALPIRIPQFIGIGVHSHGLSDEEAKQYIDRYKQETGLPVEDVIRFPTGELANALEKVVLDYESKQ